MSLRRAGSRVAFLVVLLGVLLVAPAGVANADPLWWQAITNPNSICSPSDPVPETAGTGLSGLVDPPGVQRPVTHYNNYEMAGLTWHATDLGCSDYLAIVGNYAANFVFMVAKAIDRVTITAYQTAYSPGLLDSLSNAVAGLVTSLRDTFYLPYVTPVVLLGVIWMAWQGLIRRRATASVEGVVWMIIAVTLALWFLNRPSDILRAGNAVVNGANCAITKGVAQVDPNTTGQCFADTARGPSAVSQTANSLWTVLVYRPWLAGEFGHAAAEASGDSENISAPLARKYGGFGEQSLLWTQAISHKDLAKMRQGGQYDAGAASTVINAKHDRWTAIKEDVKNNHPAVYPLFQGRQWESRLGIAFAAFIAAVFAGGLILLVSVALIVLKLGFLLLIMTGPFFLLAGIHPGVGRIIATRWGELLVSTLLKQIVVALALAVLLFGYSVITTGSTLSWGLQVLLLSLLGIAAFIYRKPFQHLFATVGGTTFGGRVLGESAATNPELAAAHRRLATAPAGPPAVRRIGGRLASTAFGGAVAGAVGGKAGAAAAGASASARRADRDGVTTPGAAGPNGAAAAAGEMPGAETEAEEPRAAKERRLAGLRSGPRTGSPPPLDLSGRRSVSGRTGPAAGQEPEDAASAGPPPARGEDHDRTGGAGGAPARPAAGAGSGARPPRTPWPGTRQGARSPAAGAPPGESAAGSAAPGDAAGSAGGGAASGGVAGAAAAGANGRSGGEPRGGSWWQGTKRRPRPAGGSSGGERSRSAPVPPPSSPPPDRSTRREGTPPPERVRARGEQAPDPQRRGDGAHPGTSPAEQPSRRRRSRGDGDPPLWSSRRADSAPPLPFWLRSKGGGDDE